jgi:uncharacterized RDD family membrane protein YckC
VDNTVEEELKTGDPLFDEAEPGPGGPIELPKANLLKRWGASFLDEGVWLVLAQCLGWFISGPIIPFLGMAIASVQDAPFGGGTSVGRKIVDQALVDAEGFECTIGKGFARNGLRVLMWIFILPIFIDIGLVLFHPQGKTMADLILGTQVVDRPYARLRPDQIPGGDPAQLT